MTLDPSLAVATDNDVLLKAVCYGLTADFWPGAGVLRTVFVLGAARYVVAQRVGRATLRKPRAEARAEFLSLLASVTELEPTIEEIGLAASIEVAAQRAGVALDAGESQLTAVVILRAIPVLETGDKRAIRAVDVLLDQADPLPLVGVRLRCLEQIVWRLVSEPTIFDRVANAVCAESAVDRTMSICFGCFSPQRPSAAGVVAGLESYIDDLRRDAGRVLVP
jgi:hypothetical protein